MKRALVANLLDRIGATELMFNVRREWLPVLTFHRVIDPVPGYLFDDGVVDATPAELDRCIGTVAEHFNPVTIEDVVRHADGAALPPSPLLVTFDDGYRDNYTHALPILTKHHVPATFFIATDYIDERRVFWWDRISYLIKASRRAWLTMLYPAPLRVPIDTPRAKAAAIETLCRIVKTRFALDLPRFLDELSLASGVAWDPAIERGLADAALMTWDEIRALHAAGMDVQSHTRSHRVLQTLPPAQLREELAGSRARLERELGVPITAISYPVGHRIDRGDLRDAIAGAGYKVGFTNATGTQSTRARLDRFDIRRISLDLGTPAALFRAILAAPAVFG